MMSVGLPFRPPPLPGQDLQTNTKCLCRFANILPFFPNEEYISLPLTIILVGDYDFR